MAVQNLPRIGFGFVSGPSENAAFRLDTLLKIKHLHTVGAAPMVTFGSGR